MRGWCEKREERGEVIKRRGRKEGEGGGERRERKRGERRRGEIAGDKRRERLRKGRGG